MGLQAIIDKGVTRDSALVIYQLQGEWETRDLRLLLYHKHVTGMIKHLMNSISLTCVGKTIK